MLCLSGDGCVGHSKIDKVVARHLIRLWEVAQRLKKILINLPLGATSPSSYASKRHITSVNMIEVSLTPFPRVLMGNTSGGMDKQTTRLLI